MSAADDPHPLFTRRTHAVALALGGGWFAARLLWSAPDPPSTAAFVAGVVGSLVGSLIFAYVAVGVVAVLVRAVRGDERA